MTARQERQANRDKLLLARLKELAAEAKKAEEKAKVEAAKVKPKPPRVIAEPKPVEKKEPAKSPFKK